MEAEKVSFIQEALKGFLKCLGLQNVVGTTVTSNEEVVINAAEPATNYPISEVHYSPIEKTTPVTFMETNYGGSTAAEAPNVEGGVTKVNITGRRITSGGGGKTN